MTQRFQWGEKECPFVLVTVLNAKASLHSGFDPCIFELNELNTPPKICWCTANDKTLSWEFDNSRPLTTNWSTEGFFLYWKHKWTSASATPAWAMCGLTVFLAIPRYGQMTAGSYCYIGPQGIVHGTVVRNWGKVSVSTFWRRLSPAVAGDGSGLDCCERIFWLLKKFSLPAP